MTSSPEYEILPKLLPQVIKAIVDLHELNGSTIDDIIDQVKTNMAFYGIRSTKKNIKAQVHLSLRHGVRLGCFRVESQGRFRINKLKYCVPVLKCVMPPYCVRSAIRSRYLLRHCSSREQSRQQQLPQEQLHLPTKDHKQTKHKTCSTVTRAIRSSRSSTRMQSTNNTKSQQDSPPYVNEVISELNSENIFPFSNLKNNKQETRGSCSLKSPPCPNVIRTTRSSRCSAKAQSADNIKSQQESPSHISEHINEMNNEIMEKTTSNKQKKRNCLLKAPARSSGCSIHSQSIDSVKSQRSSPPHVSKAISEMNNEDMERSILPFFRDPLTSYKKSSNTSVICIFDPAGHMGPQMECGNNINMNGGIDNIPENIAIASIQDNVPTTFCQKITSSAFSTKMSSTTFDSSIAVTPREGSLEDIRKLTRREGVLKSLQRKFDQLQKCIWGSSDENPTEMKDGYSNSFAE